MDINIALCDDDSLFIQETEKMLYTYIFNSRHEINLSKFQSASDLLKTVKSGKIYDIYLLDIEIADYNGIDAAKIITENSNSEPYIVFISNYPEYMQDSFSVHPYQYFQKPVEDSMLYRLLDEIITYKEKHLLSITVLETEKGVDIPVNIMDILCIETKNAKARKLKFHFFDKSLTARGIISDWKDMLTDYPFFPCYKGILINVYHIHFIKGNTIVLKNGEELPISRKYITRIKNEMINVINTYII